MTEVSFHLHVPDKLHYACRLVRKAHARAHSVVIVAEAPVLARLDHMLWHMGGTDFLGHVRLHAPQAAADSAPESAERAPHHAGAATAALAALRAAARIELTPDAQLSQRHDVLVNLLPTVATGFERFEKLIEIVTTDETDKQAARTRWRYYHTRGYLLKQETPRTPLPRQ